MIWISRYPRPAANAKSRNPRAIIGKEAAQTVYRHIAGTACVNIVGNLKRKSTKIAYTSYPMNIRWMALTKSGERPAWKRESRSWRPASASASSCTHASRSEETSRGRCSDAPLAGGVGRPAATRCHCLAMLAANRLARASNRHAWPLSATRRGATNARVVFLALHTNALNAGSRQATYYALPHHTRVDVVIWVSRACSRHDVRAGSGQ